MLYNIVTEQVSQWRVFHELLMNSSIHMSSVILYVKCSFSLVAWFSNDYWPDLFDHRLLNKKHLYLTA
jgi:hypothetical protein